MTYELPLQAQTYMDNCKQELTELVKTLCTIPAPSNQEQQRAAFCKDWLDKAGCRGVYIDEALNVVYPVNIEGSNSITLFTAHMDTVFPDTEPLPMEEKDGILHCPGAGDDTANVAILLLLARYIAQNDIKPQGGFLLACDTGEEALGNLKGIKQIMHDYAGRIKEAYIYDGLYGQAVNWPVAVIRYKVKVGGQGGHAYLNFGNSSAVQCSAGIIGDMYAVEIPKGCKSSYNVGVWNGGEVANAIAQHAEFLIEIRSEMKENLDWLNSRFLEIVEKHKIADRCTVELEVIGRRPGKNGVDEERQTAIDEKLRTILKHYCGFEPIFRSGSGDLNIPMSMGVPGIGFCGYQCSGVHTREETLVTESLLTGFAVNMTVMLSCL